jgi:hypothetical protein
MAYMYMVMSVKKEITLNVLSGEKTIKLCWADGMIGAVPVFKTKKLALKYGGKTEIMEVQLSNKKKAGE